MRGVLEGRVSEDKAVSKEGGGSGVRDGRHPRLEGPVRGDLGKSRGGQRAG